VAAADVPVSVDFEGGYSEDDRELAANVSKLIDLGAIGINFEDRVVKGAGLYSVERQSQRIAAIRQATDRKGIAFFINARTDLFLGRGTNDPAQSVAAANERAMAYANAGASGSFVPGLTQEALIGRISESVPLPVNVMFLNGLPARQRL
jgi:2-methylisocitrate lyase-like PEP mutase family enzyme